MSARPSLRAQTAACRLPETHSTPPLSATLPAKGDTHRKGSERGPLLLITLLLFFQAVIPWEAGSSERIRTLTLGCTAGFLLCRWLYVVPSLRAALRQIVLQAGCPAALLFSG